jgi:AraC-like DNA-binding protein
MSEFFKEITPLTPYDCFTYFSRKKKNFDFPIHYHEEYELNLILNAKGAKRIIGDHSEAIGNYELVLVGSNLPHAWINHQYEYVTDSNEIQEITIQFHKDLLDEKLLRRNQLYFVKSLFDKATKGVLFSEESTMLIKDRIVAIGNNSGFDSVLELLSILHDLSLSRNMRTLANESFRDIPVTQNSQRMDLVFEFMRKNYEKDISLGDISKIANMSEVSFSRYIKKATGKTFIDTLNDIRLGHASRFLIDTTNTISEVAFKCGFKNLSYFNRLFKIRKGQTPSEFRDEYQKQGVRTFI